MYNLRMRYCLFFCLIMVGSALASETEMPVSTSLNSTECMTTEGRSWPNGKSLYFHGPKSGYRYCDRGKWVEPPKTPEDQRLVANPTSGSAPVTVIFTSVYGYPRGTQDAAVFLDFGDGKGEPVYCFQDDDKRNGECRDPAIIHHTYEQPGTFQAKLKSGGMCPSPPCEKTVAFTTVTITGNEVLPSRSILISILLALLVAAMAMAIRFWSLRKPSS